MTSAAIYARVSWSAAEERRDDRTRFANAKVLKDLYAPGAALAGR